MPSDDMPPGKASGDVPGGSACGEIHGMIALGLNLGAETLVTPFLAPSPRLESVVSLLAAYVREIETFNPALSLVGTNDRRELVTRHILDSLSPLGIIAESLAKSGFAIGTPPGGPPVQIADVGSGAGLPGIPLAIALPDAQFTLIERKGRRAGFLRKTLKVLGLPNVSVEEQEMEKVKPGRFALVTFRAFRPLDPGIYKKLARLCTKGGALAAYKGRREKTEAEIWELEKAVPSLAKRWELLPCPVPGLDEERHLLLINPA